MGSLVKYLDYNVPELQIRVLSTVSLLIQNLKEESQLSNCGVSVECVLGHKGLNEIILHDYDFGHEELTTQYISFLKSLSLRISKSTLRYFFSEVL